MLGAEMPQTIVAIMTAVGDGEINADKVAEVERLIEDASDIERTMLIAAFASLHGNALNMIERLNPNWEGREAYLRVMGLKFMLESGGDDAQA